MTEPYPEYVSPFTFSKYILSTFKDKSSSVIYVASAFSAFEICELEPRSKSITRILI
jgi:hypothetical protein